MNYRGIIGIYLVGICAAIPACGGDGGNSFSEEETAAVNYAELNQLASVAVAVDRHLEDYEEKMEPDYKRLGSIAESFLRKGNSTYQEFGGTHVYSTKASFRRVRIEWKSGSDRTAYIHLRPQPYPQNFPERKIGTVFVDDSTNNKNLDGWAGPYEFTFRVENDEHANSNEQMFGLLKQLVDLQGLANYTISEMTSESDTGQLITRIMDHVHAVRWYRTLNEKPQYERIEELLRPLFRSYGDAKDIRVSGDMDDAIANVDWRDDEKQMLLSVRLSFGETPSDKIDDSKYADMYPMRTRDSSRDEAITVWAGNTRVYLNVRNEGWQSEKKVREILGKVVNLKGIAEIDVSKDVSVPQPPPWNVRLIDRLTGVSLGLFKNLPEAQRFRDPATIENLEGEYRDIFRGRYVLDEDPQEPFPYLDLVQSQFEYDKAMISKLNWYYDRDYRSENRNVATSEIIIRDKPNIPNGAQLLNEKHYIERLTDDTVLLWAGHHRIELTLRDDNIDEWRGRMLELVQGLYDLDGLARVTAKL